MNDVVVDWETWEAEQPVLGFADRVMAAVSVDRPEVPVISVRRASSARKLALLAAAAFAVASAGVFAAVGWRTRATPASSAGGPSVAPRAVASAPTADAKGPGERAAVVPPGVRIDPKLREDVRAKFERGLEGRGVERDPHTGLAIPSGAHAASTRLSREYIQARIRQDFFPLAISCYESALVRSPNLRGRIVVDFMIVGDAKVGGIVDQAEIDEQSDIEDAEFRTCLRESMLSMVFEAPENDGWVTVTYPFVFAPDDEGQRDR
jgi:hypothetical protein